MIVRKGLTGESPAPITRASARAAVPGIRVPLVVLSGSLTLFNKQEGIGGRRRLVCSVAGLFFVFWSGYGAFGWLAQFVYLLVKKPSYA